MRKCLLALLLCLTLVGCAPQEPTVTPTPVTREAEAVIPQEPTTAPQAETLPKPETPKIEEPKAEESPKSICTVSISCKELLEDLSRCDPEKVELIPSDGWILPPTQVEAVAGESVFDLLLRVCKAHGILMEYTDTPMYDSAYIEGIGGLYEFDAGPLSGWRYSVNGTFPNYGSSRYILQENDTVCWEYTCDLNE